MNAFAAESVAEGNPDKVADQLADSVLDAILTEDRFARVSCKVMVSTGLVVVGGEVTTKTWIDIGKIIRIRLREIGYDTPVLGFDGSSCAVINILEEQSSEIGLAVDRHGAGEQCTVFGYATDEGEALPGGAELMPVPIFLAHRLARSLGAARKTGVLPCLLPDGKTQVCVEYEEDRPARLRTVVLSVQHTEGTSLDRLRAEVRRVVIEENLASTGLLDGSTEVLINPAGTFTRGGPQVDAGFSGAKTSVDAYGSASRQADCGLCGKDPTKPERCGAYMARHIAKSLVRLGIARRCELRCTYVIGREQPIAVDVDTFGTAREPDAVLGMRVRERFDLSVPAIIETFDLRRPIYSPLACYGQFGRPDLDLPWEAALPGGF
ncbi:MAG: methionine adenosyltransferase [Deltaproteobacteria bacterium]|nr:methionine adenosyltransferase [Deltaproteobacteria bacterium]